MMSRKLILWPVVAALTIVLSGCASSPGNPALSKTVPAAFNPKQRSGPGWVQGVYVGMVHPNMVFDAKEALYLANRAEEGAIPMSSLSNAYLAPELVASAQRVVKQELANLKGAKLQNPTYIGIRRSKHVGISERAAKSGTATRYLVNICFFSGWSAVKGNAQVAPAGYFSTTVTMTPAGTHGWQVLDANPSSISGPTACTSHSAATHTTSHK